MFFFRYCIEICIFDSWDIHYILEYFHIILTIFFFKKEIFFSLYARFFFQKFWDLISDIFINLLINLGA